ncbi:pyrroline-5-carboxylate reductase family protein, partial [Idiomarina sp. ST10R2A5]|uniref:pyrroline-5-carboxylate reductase family protein n=1 Tax=Idiomarina sp. ST10R2A5 TaxID=3418368 RepID=UPI003EC6E00F
PRPRRSHAADETTEDTDSGTEDAEIVVLAVKPDIAEPVLGDLDLDADQQLVTLAAGLPREFVAERTAASVVRIMPNLAA